MTLLLCNIRFGARKISSAVAQAAALSEVPIDRILLGNKNRAEREKFCHPFLISF